MCDICFYEWHKSGAATYWEYYRSAHDSNPPWMEEARHSDIRMTGNGSRPKDGQSIFYWMPYGVKLVNKPFQIYRSGILRHLRITGQDTTQGCLSFID